jgi:predicted amidohydrolase YtcJ
VADNCGTTRQWFSFDEARFYPLRSYLDAGIRLAAGSDHMIGHDRNHAVNP